MTVQVVMFANKQHVRLTIPTELAHIVRGILDDVLYDGAREFPQEYWPSPEAYGVACQLRDELKEKVE